MKFGKELRQTVDSSIPEWRPMFMSYKALKQLIERSPPTATGGVVNGSGHGGGGGGGSGGAREGALPRGTVDAYPAGGSDVESGRSGKRPAAASAAAAAAAVAVPAGGGGTASVAAGARAAGGRHPTPGWGSVGRGAFFATLRSDVNKVNDFYLNQEEEVIILFHLLSVQVDEVVAAAAAATGAAEKGRCSMVEGG